MFKRASLVLAASAIALLSANAQTARVVTRIVSDTVATWKTWKSDAGTLNYPGAWSVITAAGGDTVAVFTKPSQAGASATPKVTLVVGPVAGETRPGAPEGVNVQVISSTPPDASGAFSVEYTVDAGGTVLHHLKEVRIAGDRAYALDYSAPSLVFEENLFLAEALMKSFSPSTGSK